MKISLLFLTLFLSANLTFPSQNFKELIDKADFYYQRREERENIEEAIKLYKEALKIEPDSYEINRKLARSYFNLGDLLPEDTEDSPIIKSNIGREGMKYGEEAVEINPDGIEGNFFYALNIGMYAHGIRYNISVWRAIREGLMGLYVKRLKMVIDKDRSYLFALPLVAMGKYYHRLPLPHHLKKAEKYLKEAIKLYPENLRAHLYLGEVYLDMKRLDLAKEEFEFVLSHKGIPQMHAENRKDKEIAKRYLLKE